MSAERHKWHALESQRVAEILRTTLSQGLSEEEIRTRQMKFGSNTLDEGKRFTIVRTIVKQLMSPLALVLLLAGVAALFLHEILDAIVIGIALLVNVTVGTIQEGRASKVFKTLASSQERHATVFRNGRRHIVPVESLVPGDVIYLEGGSSVPADVRIIDAQNLAVNEAALTGEWVSVAKNTELCDEQTTLNERRNMAWRGTTVTEGHGRGIIVATGDHTQMGQIARDTQQEEEHATPLQRSVARLARFLMVIIGIAIVAIVLLGIVRGEPFAEMLLIAIAVAVAAIPSGLPAAVTVVLAIGMEAILRKGGLVKNLLAAETLGSTTIILTDKTGTLTQGQMSVSALYTARGIDQHDDTTQYPDNRELLTTAILASDAFTEEKNGTIEVHGRPIEKAIVALGIDEGISQRDLFAHGHDRLDFLQFTSSRRFSASLNQHPSGRRLYFSGAPEYLLERSRYCMGAAGGVREMDEQTREEFASVQRAESAQGNRFIGVAYRACDAQEIPDNIVDGSDVRDLVFVGMVAFSDKVRPDVAAEIQTAKNAHARVIMVTGDYPETARSIAVQTGLAPEGASVITGRDIEDMEDSELVTALKENTIFARVLPQQKLRLARVLRSEKEVVAMTGDGVNDAPALVSADIGVAVGAGTDVAKEAADIVLLNNTFSTITAAIREGRRAVDNLRKIIAYLLSTSFSEIILIGGALAGGLPLPLLPSQILWANLVEEGLMSFPFAFEPAQRDVMNRPPRRPQRGKSPHLVLTGTARRVIFTVTAVTGVLLLGLYAILHYLQFPIDEIRTVMFVALSLDSIFFAFSFKNLQEPLWRIRLADNKFLFIALTVSILLLIAALTFPPLQTLLTLTDLTFFEIGLLTILGLVNLITIEVTKWWARK